TRARFESFANRVLVSPIMFGRFFADNDAERTIERVLIVEIASANERDSHGCEVTGSNRAIDNVGPLIDWRIWNALDRDGHRIAVVGKGKIVCRRGRMYTGQLANASQDFIEERRASLRVRIFHLGKVDIEREQTVCSKTGIEIAQMHEAVDE